MKKRVNLLIFILTLAFVMAAVACLPTASNSTKAYTVTVNLNGGAGVSAESFLKDGRLTEPSLEPVKDGYVFDGWYLDEACETQKVVFGAKLKKDIVIHAKWVKEGKKATFFLGSYTEEITVEEQDGRITPPIVSRDGYRFLGWFREKELLNEATDFNNVNDGAVFYAKWKADSFTITYDLDGLGHLSVSAKLSYSSEDAFLLVAPANIAKGYRFVNWVDENGNAVTSIEKGSSGNRAFKAVYISSNKNVESVKSGFVSQKDKTIEVHVPFDQASIKLGEYLNLSARATAKITDESGVNAENITLNDGENAGFTVTVEAEDGSHLDYGVKIYRHQDVEYTVKYYFTLGGEYEKLREDESVKAATVLTESLNAEEKSGYVFAGWFTDGENDVKYTHDAPILADTALYARYVGAVRDIIYYLGIGVGNENPNSFTMGVGLKLKAAEAPENYEFKGWALAMDSDEFIEEIAADRSEEITLYARYAVKDTAKIAYLEDDAFKIGQEIAAEQISDIINWAIYRRLTELEFVITDAESTGGDILDKVNEAVGNNIEVPFLTRGKMSGNVQSVKDVHTVTLKFGEFIEPGKSTGKALYAQAAYPEHGLKTEGREEKFDEFKINSIQNTVEVADTEQLYFAAENGYRPLPKVGSSAERVYKKAKTVLREIIDDNMTDIEKAHAIFDWIIINVTYDDELLRLGTQKDENGQNNVVNDYNGFYLEGVFDDKLAVCDGISKAYVLMCRMEGIPCIQVVGRSKESEVGHAWNKIKIDGKWYVVCPTSGGTVFNDTMEMLNHAFFMTNDAKMQAKYVENGDYPEANEVYDLYKDGEFTFDGKTYKLKAEDRTEVIAATKYLISSGTGLRNIDIKINYNTDESGLNRALGEAAAALKYDVKKMSYKYTDGVLIIIILE